MFSLWRYFARITLVLPGVSAKESEYKAADSRSTSLMIVVSVTGVEMRKCLATNKPPS